MTRSVAWPLQFVLLAAIWGSSFVLIKIGLTGLAPLHVAVGRVGSGALALLVVLAVRRERLPAPGRIWLHLAVAAAMLNAVPFALFAYAEQRISSTLAGIGNATTPLFTMLVAMALLPAERPTPRRLAGLGIGFVGVLVVLNVWSSGGSADPVGLAMVLAAALSYGVGFAYVRRFLGDAPNSALALSAGQLVVGTVQLGIVVPLVAGPLVEPNLEAVLAVAGLGLIGTGFAYVLQYNLIRTGDATAASAVTYLIPVFSTIAGIALLDEPLRWNEPVGAIVIIAGALLAAGVSRVQASRRQVR